MIRDIQEDGVYNNLHYLEAASLLHNHIGITLKTCEFIAPRNLENPKENYNLINTFLTTFVEYPFGETPLLELYYRGAHFEIQPHENLADANREYEEEVNQLSPPLREVHDAISFAQQAFESNAALGKLFLYVSGKLHEQLTQEAQCFTAPDSKSYVVTVEQYAENGHLFHENNHAGRLTFAVILLTIASDVSTHKAKDLLRYLDRLSTLSAWDTPMATYFSDTLAKAITHSKMNLEDKIINEVVQDIETDYDFSKLGSRPK